MSIKEKKTVFLKKNSLEYVVFIFLLQNTFRTSFSVKNGLNIRSYTSIKNALYRLRDKKLIQCYGQRWTPTKNSKIICKIKKL